MKNITDSKTVESIKDIIDFFNNEDAKIQGETSLGFVSVEYYNLNYRRIQDLIIVAFNMKCYIRCRGNNYNVMNYHEEMTLVFESLNQIYNLLLRLKLLIS